MPNAASGCETWQWCAGHPGDHQSGRHSDEWEGVAGAGAGAGDGVIDGEAAYVCRILYDADGHGLSTLLSVTDEDGTKAMIRLNRGAAAKIAALLTRAAGL